MQTAHYQSYYIDEIKLFVDFFLFYPIYISEGQTAKSVGGGGAAKGICVMCCCVIIFAGFPFSLCIRT